MKVDPLLTKEIYKLSCLIGAAGESALVYKIILVSALVYNILYKHVLYSKNLNCLIKQFIWSRLKMVNDLNICVKCSPFLISHSERKGKIPKSNQNKQEIINTREVLIWKPSGINDYTNLISRIIIKFISSILK